MYVDFYAESITEQFLTFAGSLKPSKLAVKSGYPVKYLQMLMAI